MSDRFIVLTGAPCSGKTTLLQYLHTLGFQVVAEPARQILSEQRSIAGNGLPNKDAHLFVDLMLSRMIGEYNRLEAQAGPIFFDRGIPDAIGYASHFGFDYLPGQNAAGTYRYHSRVFFAPAWEPIYTKDEERRLSYQAACRFGGELRKSYQQAGYTLVDLPCLSVEARAQFILKLWDAIEPLLRG